MNLLLQRYRMFPDCTIGKLSIDGIFFCHTLEDTVRPSGKKIQAKTAIPAGTYAIQVNWSQRFQKALPQILKVPGFEGVRIHGGNTAADTEGCVLVGFALDLSAHRIYRSASSKLLQRLMDTKENHSITIINGTEVK